jgi:transposase
VRRESAAMNELSVTEREQVLGLLRLGWSERRIARETGHHRLTVWRIAQELAKGDADRGAAAEAVAAPALEALPARSTTSRSSCEPYRVFIEAELAKGRNAMAIYQDLVEHRAFDGAYNAVKRFARKIVPSEPWVSCRFETAAGEEAQVDYGEGALTLDPRTRKYRRPRLFVMTLGYSRHAFRKVVWNSSSETWCRLHEEAFAFFGGTTRLLRLDNLKEGVIKPDIYDPELNALFAAMLAYYNVVALPCRPYAPDLKGKVESAVGYTQRTALKGRRFESLDAQNEFLARWDAQWAINRIHGTVKRQVREMFIEERPFLAPLPTTCFEYYRIVERRVHLDGYIQLDGGYYHAPPHYVGSTVVVHVGRLWVRILDPTSRQCVREHTVTGKGQRRTVDAYLPKQTPPKIETVAKRVAQAGPACGAFARAALAERGPIAVRTLFGVLQLLRRYDPQEVERACQLATTAQTWRLHFLRAYLDRHATPQKLRDDHPVIPGLERYIDHFNTMTNGEPT